MLLDMFGAEPPVCSLELRSKVGAGWSLCGRGSGHVAPIHCGHHQAPNLKLQFFFFFFSSAEIFFNLTIKFSLFAPEEKTARLGGCKGMRNLYSITSTSHRLNDEEKNSMYYLNYIDVTIFTEISDNLSSNFSSDMESRRR